MKQVKTMKAVLSTFWVQSGQHVNSNKSKIWISPNSPHQLVGSVSKILEMKLTANLGMYLGILIDHDWVLKKTFGYLIEKVRRKLSNWKASLLSRGAKILLIQSVTSTISLYTMQTTLIPHVILDEIEKINLSFLWGANSGIHFCSPVAWKGVWLPKNLGRFGLQNLHLMNLVALSRLCWWFLQNLSALWVQIHTAKYGNLAWNTPPHRQISCSHTLKSLLQGFEGMNDYLSFCLGQQTILPTRQLNNYGQFSSASLWEKLSSVHSSQPSKLWERVWKFKGPSNPFFTLWLATHDRLFTM